MKKLLLLILPILILCTTGCTFANNKNAEFSLSNKKILIAYFSWSGNTQYIAEKIHNTTGGDMFKIETATPYPSDYQETAYGIAKKQHDENIKPKLKNNGDVSSYDVIFVGTPVWWYEMTPAVKTFLTENNFEGKTIVPFITHGGGGQYTIAKDMEKLAKGSKVLTPFVVESRGDNNVQSEINSWLKELK